MDEAVNDSIIKNKIYENLVREIDKRKSMEFSLVSIPKEQAITIVGGVRYFNSDAEERKSRKNVFCWNSSYFCLLDFFIYAVFNHQIYSVKEEGKVTFFSKKLEGSDLYEFAKIKCELHIQINQNVKDWPVYLFLLECPLEKDRVPKFKKNASEEDFAKTNTFYDSFGNSYKKDLLLKELQVLGWGLRYCKQGLEIIKEKTLKISEVA